MMIELDNSPATILSLRTARAQCVMRVVQLAGCRVCGEDVARFQGSADLLANLIHQLENEDVQAVVE